MSHEKVNLYTEIRKFISVYNVVDENSWIEKKL